MDSLGTSYFRNSREMYPALDEKLVMGTGLGAKVPLHQVPCQQFVEDKHLQDFCLFNAAANDGSGTENSYRKASVLYTTGQNKTTVEAIKETDGDNDDIEGADELEDDERACNKGIVDYSDEEATGEKDQEMDRKLKRETHKLINSTRQNTKKPEQKKKYHGKKSKSRLGELLLMTENTKDSWSAKR